MWRLSCRVRTRAPACCAPLAAARPLVSGAAPAGGTTSNRSRLCATLRAAAWTSSRSRWTSGAAEGSERECAVTLRRRPKRDVSTCSEKRGGARGAVAATQGPCSAPPHQLEVVGRGLEDDSERVAADDEWPRGPAAAHGRGLGRPRYGCGERRGERRTKVRCADLARAAGVGVERHAVLGLPRAAARVKRHEEPLKAREGGRKGEGSPCGPPAWPPRTAPPFRPRACTSSGKTASHCWRAATGYGCSVSTSRLKYRLCESSTATRAALATSWWGGGSSSAAAPPDTSATAAALSSLAWRMRREGAAGAGASSSEAPLPNEASAAACAHERRSERGVEASSGSSGRGGASERAGWVGV